MKCCNCNDEATIKGTYTYTNQNVHNNKHEVELEYVCNYCKLCWFNLQNHLYRNDRNGRGAIMVKKKVEVTNG